MGFALRVNYKTVGRRHPDRDAQFAHVHVLRSRGQAEQVPLISIDTKKKELIGDFKQAGVKWDRRPEHVNDHDFRTDAKALAAPYGIYDLNANRGTVFVGTLHDTSDFVVDCLESWWRTEGWQRYPGASKWNPIEHRLFSEISKNWAAKPLDSLETVLNTIRSTTTRAGLAVCAHLVDTVYPTGVNIFNKQMRTLNIVHATDLPRWNYTIRPH